MIIKLVESFTKILKKNKIILLAFPLSQDIWNRVEGYKSGKEVSTNVLREQKANFLLFPFLVLIYIMYYIKIGFIFAHKSNSFL